MIQLENETLTVTIAEKGAEVQTVTHKETGLNYMWEGDPAYWGRIAPVLFPIVGRLKHDCYQAEGQTYTMKQHGFLRDTVFEVRDITAEQAVFVFSSAGSLTDVYPYEFETVITYQLEADRLEVSWEVHNLDDKEMHFSIGAHPAFRIPLYENESADDYQLRMKPEGDIPVAEYELMNGLIQKKGEKTTLPAMPIKADMFANDALIFSNVEQVSLLSEQGHGVILDLPGFPYVGIWSPYQAETKRIAPFVCIEPWFGIADTVDTSGELSEKQGIQKLKSSETFQASYRIQYQ